MHWTVFKALVIKSGWFWKPLSRKQVLNNHFLKSIQKEQYIDVLQNRCSYKFRSIQKKILSLIFELKSTFNEVVGPPATLFKRDFNTGVFLYILQHFYEQHFL